MEAEVYKIKKHDFQSSKNWRGLECQHCNATWESDLGGPGFPDDIYCNERIVADHTKLLTADEYSFLVNWKGYRFNVKTGLWSRPFDDEDFTTSQVRAICPNKIN